MLVTSPDARGVPTIRAFCETRSPPRWQRHAFFRDGEFIDRMTPRTYGHFGCRVPADAIPPGESQQIEFWALDFARFAVHRIPGDYALPALASVR